jgi:hypothetical protein
MHGLHNEVLETVGESDCSIGETNSVVDQVAAWREKAPWDVRTPARTKGSKHYGNPWCKPGRTSVTRCCIFNHCGIVSKAAIEALDESAFSQMLLGN